MTNAINPEYARKLTVAGEIADDAWLLGGLTAMEAELATLRRMDADPTIIAELHRIVRRQIALLP